MYGREAPDQWLTQFVSNEDVLAHPCHEYVLDQLQRGVSPDEVVQVLFQEYLVETTRTRLLAYRRFVESSGPYWTLEHLKLHHWEYLYQQVPLRQDGSAVVMRSHHERRRGIRMRFCEHAATAEESALLWVLRTV